MLSEGQQELVLPADICGEDEGTQLLFYVLPGGEREGGGQGPLKQTLLKNRFRLGLISCYLIKQTTIRRENLSKISFF